MSRQYFSQRKHGAKPLDFDQIRTVFMDLFKRLEGAGYLREYFGADPMEQLQALFGTVKVTTGIIGSDPSAYILLRLGKENLWPVPTHIPDYSEEDLFDIMEFLYDHVSAPESNFGGKYDKDKGRAAYRNDLNNILIQYGEGYELTPDGMIVPVGEEGLREVFSADLPTDDEKIKEKVSKAIRQYRDRHSDWPTRRDAVRDLADVCERLRSQIKKSMYKKDEDGLFDIANNYGIRHHNDIQKTEYGPEWLSWFFYLYLSTVHLCLRIMKREAKGEGTAP